MHTKTGLATKSNNHKDLFICSPTTDHIQLLMALSFLLNCKTLTEISIVLNLPKL